ncbi:MAG: hypothetical protein DI533_10105 [Cereibacter sphaeroides]|uniref:Uncharacterized protein n=1 Tax=Cereibacter sphaeroides TaxID=1063 RepID=A0A2W5SP03_CERSP|nr:MAG: hypothetical protein DI533_10105 [Cereibacter sphaeroides]
MLRIGSASLVVSLLALTGARAQEDCTDLTNCVTPVDVGANTEGITEMPMEPITGDGFSITIDGAPVIGDAGFADTQRRADIALSDSDIDVRFDGLGIRPRLDIQTIGEGPFGPGQTVTFRNRMNYPSVVEGGELRILDLDAPGGARTVEVVPLAPNTEVTTALPQGKRLAYVYRVTDPSRRYDETRPVLLGTSFDRGLTDLATQEEGSDNAAVRNIPVRGGAVTVYVQNLPPGAKVETLGTVVTPDGSGKAVIQRVLPVGARTVDVRVIHPNGTSQTISRDINIPKSEWFYVGVADLTFGRSSGGGEDGGGDTYNSGRLSGYAKGTTARGFQITMQADSGEDDIDNLFSNILDKDPNSILNRLDPDLAYPTYGDNSELIEDAPTSGGFYIKVEKNGNFGLWGDFKSTSQGTELLRNERTLYGAQTVLQTQAANSEGSPRLRFEGYAAQPDQLPQRDVLRGTGGSVYFLTKQDILVGSETLTVELRDGNTQRVISRTSLVQGEDYDINYIQGVITLYSPLSGYGSSGALLSSNPNGDDTLNLIAQYEWRPAVGDVDGYAYGGRLTSGIADGWQLGATAQIDNSGEADQTAYGIDLSWQKSDRTFLKAEIARTDGPGFGYISSLNGGLTNDTTDAPDGSGNAYRIEAQAALDELWAGGAGVVSAYYQSFDAGFSSLDYQITDPELYWGFAAELPLSQSTGLILSYDHYDEDPGVRDDQGKVILRHQLSPRMAVELGYGRLDSEDPTSTDDTGTRDDVAARLIMSPSDRLEWYVFGQGSLNVTGDLDRSDRLGVGGEVAINDNWSIKGEVSDGATGVGARVMFGQDKGEESSVYFGYALDPDRTIDDVVLTGNDQGQFVAGGRRRYSDSVTAYAENTYDLFGQQTSLTSTYGVEYQLTERTIYSGAIETGVVTGDPDGDVDRTSVSVGVRHDNGEQLNLRGRIEVIQDDSDDGTLDTYLLTGLARYELTNEARIVADLEAMFNETASESLPEGDYFDLSLGYAFRPILNDRLNVLAKYEYLNNMVDQLVDDEGNTEPLQRSQVLSLDAEYDLSPRWTIGGKIGGRLSKSAPDQNSAFSDNDAWLVVANARYHLVREWDLLIEGRNLTTVQGGTSNFGTVIGAYKQIGEHVMLGASYNFADFSDDLTDLTQDDRGAQINLIAKF